MMDEAIIRALSLYFYLNLFDTKAAFSAAQKALSTWNDLGSNVRSEVIPIATKVLQHSKGTKFFAPASVIGEFKVPNGLHIDQWREFQKRGDTAEIEAVLWSQVLGFTDQEIADGLGITEGTVRHRVSRGLRELGRYL